MPLVLTHSLFTLLFIFTMVTLFNVASLLLFGKSINVGSQRKAMHWNRFYSPPLAHIIQLRHFKIQQCGRESSQGTEAGTVPPGVNSFPQAQQ